jgi:hypothetical protein
MPLVGVTSAEEYRVSAYLNENGETPELATGYEAGILT